MKIVQLNRRFRQHRDHGHTIALRFDHGGYSDIRTIEQLCCSRLGFGGWLREHDWYSYYGQRSGRVRDHNRPYWITFRRESDLTLVLLAADLTNNPTGRQVY